MLPILVIDANHTVVQVSPLRDSTTSTFIGVWALTAAGVLEYFPAPLSSPAVSVLPLPPPSDITFSQLSGTCALQTNGIVRCFVSYPFVS
jgi:hypothetical protein